MQQERDRLQTIVEISAALVGSRLELQHMFPAIAQCIRKSVAHDAAVANIWRESEQCFEVYSCEPELVAGIPPQGLKIPAEKTGTSEVLTTSDGRVVSGAELQALAKRYEHVKAALDAGLVSWCTAAMRTANGLVGVLYLGNRQENAFGENDLDLLKQVAAVSALFVENALTHGELRQEKQRLQALLEVSRTLVSSLDLGDLFGEISNCIRRIVGHDQAYLALYNPAGESMRIHELKSPFGKDPGAEPTAVPFFDTPAGITFQQRDTKCYTRADLEEIGSEFTTKLLEKGVRSVRCFPLLSRGRGLGTLCIAREREETFPPAEVKLLEQIAPQIAIAVDNAEAYREIATLRDKLAKEKLYLEEEICLS